MVDHAAIVADLAAEHAALDAMVAGLDETGWLTPTPAAGWDVRDSVSHLCYFDRTATLALTDPDGFAAHLASLVEAGGLPDGDDTAIGPELGGVGLYDAWRQSRAGLLEAAAAHDPATRVQWYGPAMSLGSFVTARLMETWAHGCDVADGLGLPLVVSPRLRHVCHLGVGARAYAFLVHGVPDPGDPVRVELTGPDGDQWSWGAADAADRVEGDAIDFALLVTQRRHRDDVDLHVTGPTATAWMAIAQAFAGPAGAGRAPGGGGAAS